MNARTHTSPTARPRANDARCGWRSLPARILALAVVGAAVGACGGAPEHAPPARAWTDPGEVTRGAWTLYYAALPSTDFDAAVAKEYGVAPRARLALVTVSLLRGGDPRLAADATVDIGARTLIGQPRSVRTRRIARDGIVSWLGEVEFSTRETLVFTVRATIPGEADALTAEFHREFPAAD
jgi:hypothetical protein